MRVLIWLITLFALAVGLAMLVSQDWGYVQFVVPQWVRAQMSLKLFAVLLLVGFIVTYLLVRLVHSTLTLPEVVGLWRERRRRQRADRSLREALLSFHEGRYAQALKFAEKAYAASDHPVTAALLAARAAHALRDDARYRLWLKRLTEEGSEARVARLMTEAELAVNSRNFKEAAEKLEILHQEGHHHIAALRLSLRVASALRRWEEVLKLTRQLRKHKALTDAQALPLLRRAHVERLREQAGHVEELSQVWNDIPSDERTDRLLVAEAVPLLTKVGKGHVVQRLIERLLDDEWDSDLARLYGYCGGGDKSLARCERWEREHPDDAGLLFAFGRLCALSKLWGPAEKYFRASLALKPEIETHLALARLFEHQLNRDADAQHHYRAAADLVTV
jgi:HemY protein